MIDKTTTKLLISRLNKYAFEAFCFELLSSKYNVVPLEELGEGIYHRQLSVHYGESWDNARIDGIYLCHYLPFELLNDPCLVEVNDSEIIQRLENCFKAYRGDSAKIEQLLGEPFARGLQAIFFLNNYGGKAATQYYDAIYSKYGELLNRLNHNLSPFDLWVGDANSFVDNQPSQAAQLLRNFLKAHKEGISIGLAPDNISVNRFSFDKPLFSGVTKEHRYPYETVFIDTQSKQLTLLKEFEALIKNDVRESQLEEFLVEHYQNIFGVKYDRIETQLWLKFPTLDIFRKERKLDIFLRNSIANDWELFEVKRAIKLTRSYRDSQVLAAEVCHAMQQIKNYSKLLSQDAVKKHFAAEGIEYYEPVLHVVVGRRPPLAHEQLRRLLNTDKEVRLLTYDDLLDEMKVRFQDRLNFADYTASE